jgi:hypothetical protein
VIRRACLLPVVLLLAGCNGGTVDRQDVTKDGEALDSMSCEATLIAEGVARGKVTATFAREQSAVLRVQSSNLADALARRPVASGLDQTVQALDRRAARLAALLQRLHDHAGDRVTAARLEQAFKQFGKCK